MLRLAGQTSPIHQEMFRRSLTIQLL